MFAARNRPSAPLFAAVNLTTRCNLDCVYCYMQPRSGLDMKPADFEQVIDELARLGVFLVTLSGGEPMLHPNFPDLFRYAHERFAHVMTLTNGTALRPAHLDAIRAVLAEKKGVTFQVSIDAIDPQINALTRAPAQKTLRTIEQLASIGCHVIIAIVVTRHNLQQVVPTVDALSAYTRWFHMMTVQDVRLKPGVEQQLGAEEAARAAMWTELRALGSERRLAINYPTRECDAGCASGAPCMAAFSSLVIDPDLNLRPCDRLTDVVLGNAREATIASIWQGPEALRFIDRVEPMCRTTAVA